MDLLEQKRLKRNRDIASFIMGINNIIKETETKITLLETYKKGLQQQLFPRIK